MQQQNTRQTLLRNSGAIFFIRFFPTLANLLVILYFSKRLSIETYGQYQHIWAQYYVLAALALVGLPAFALTVGTAAVVRMMRQWRASRRWLFLGWTLIWPAVFAWLQVYSGVLSFGLSFCFLLSAVAGMAQEGLLLAGRRFKILLTANLLYTLAFLWLHYVFIEAAHSLSWLFTFLLLLGLGRLLLLFPALWSVIRTKEAVETDSGSGAMRLWLHLGFFELSQVIFRWADKFVVSLFLSAGALAIYFNGTLEIPFLPILLGAVGSALLLQMQTAGENDSLSRKAEMVRLSAVVLSSLVFPLFFFLLFFAEPLFRLALSDKYLAALPVFWVMLLLLPLRAYNFVTLLQHLQKGALINIGALLDLGLALLLWYPLYRWMGLPGIALAFVLSTYAQVVFYLYYIRKLTGLRLHRILPLVNWLVKLMALLFLFAGARLLSAQSETPARALLPGVCLLFIVTAFLLLIDFRRLKIKNR